MSVWLQPAVIKWNQSSLPRETKTNPWIMSFSSNWTIVFFLPLCSFRSFSDFKCCTIHVWTKIATKNAGLSHLWHNGTDLTTLVTSAVEANDVLSCGQAVGQRFLVVQLHHTWGPAVMSRRLKRSSSPWRVIHLSRRFLKFQPKRWSSEMKNLRSFSLLLFYQKLTNTVVLLRNSPRGYIIKTWLHFTKVF